MKQGIAMALLLLLLAGCAAPQTAEMFYVEDELPQTAAEAGTPCFSIIFGLPTDAVLQAAEGYQKSYTAADGRYTIRTAIMPDCDARAAIRALTGLDLEALRPIRTRAMGMTEYRFSWCREEDGQTLLLTGAVYEDEDCCYTLVFAAPEELAKQTGTLRRQILESFSLYEDEGF